MVPGREPDAVPDRVPEVVPGRELLDDVTTGFDPYMALTAERKATSDFFDFVDTLLPLPLPLPPLTALNLDKLANIPSLLSM